MALDLNKTDLYRLLGVGEDATEKELVKAYRKAALKCHPDKNPDNPDAANEFQRLSKALEILSDVAARAAYDKTRKAKKAAEERHKVLDSKRKKFKEDLEARERASQDQKADDFRAQRNLEAEIERLRKQGSSLLEQEQEYLKEQLKKDREEAIKNIQKNTKANKEEEISTVSPKLKVTWSAEKRDDSNGGYSHGMLRAMLGKYGEVSALVISGTKNGRAIVEYKSPRAADMAFKSERGLQENPLTLKWLSGKPETPTYETVSLSHSDASPQMPSFPTESDSVSFTAVPEKPKQTSFIPKTSHERDFESLVLMKMRQAEERKRLIEQMQKEDEES
ncbi:LOW QUALITY PROTEIN: dnaJ homolog subfamily C member 17-like [Haliotis rubra]|uniref:LOW QUALITY PROTEIN: dnaJ homolog subfamily C member 17-like n=1 Tax=Haliotis rubra TaxID=36100 RepID=UPI001EE5B257|nr:LOW QUALITY PROTEIN: dnaJ homolog subfamily C member 17-like [Haliotis rubra]